MKRLAIIVLILLVRFTCGFTQPIYHIDKLQNQYSDLGDFLTEIENEDQDIDLGIIPFSEASEGDTIIWRKLLLQSMLGENASLENYILFTDEGSFIDVLVFDQKGSLLSHEKTGQLCPASEKNIQTANRVERVNFSILTQDTLTVYFRYHFTPSQWPNFEQTNNANAFPKLRLQRIDFYQSWEYLTKNRYDGLFFGFLMALILFNFLFYYATRDRAFFYQGLFICGVSIFMADSIGLLPDVVFLRDYPLFLQPVSYTSILILNLAYLKFIGAYMDLEKTFPKWHQLLEVLFKANIVVWFAVLVYYFLSHHETNSNAVIGIFAAIQYAILLFFMVFLYRTKDKKAYFLVAAGILVITAAIAAGIQEAIPFRIIPRNFLQWMLVGNVTLFFLGLAFRMKTLQEEKWEVIRLKDIGKLKTRLYTNITHEFRTPLTVIQGMVGQVESHPKVASEGKLQKAMSLINANGNRLLRLVNRLLDLAKIESGGMNLNLEQSDILRFLRYLVQSFETYALTKKIHLQLLSELSAFQMDFDKEKLEQIIINLLSNAIKFTPKGGQIFITVKSHSKNGQEQLMLKVKDTGEGIAKEELPNIFDRFYQVEGSKQKGQGTGIGLALTRELLKLMGGEIEVESEIGKGTTFTILFPVTKNAKLIGSRENVPAISNKHLELEGQLLSNDQSIKGIVGKSKSAETEDLPQLLIIEDNADIVYYLRTLLEPQYEVESAYNGQEGIDLAIETIPDIIICDVMMPLKDGFEVVQTLKNDERTSHIPIILLSAKAALEDRVTGLKKGADAYLAKPFQKEELFARLEQLRQSRKRLQERYTQSIPNKISAEENLQIEDAFLIKIRTIIEEHLDDERFGILQLCRAMRISRTQLHRKIKALSGKSTSIFLRSLRLNKAKEMLLSTDLNISEIAYAVGFSDPNYFTKTFLEEFGEQPSIFRKRFRVRE